MKDTTASELYDMKLHDSIGGKNYDIVRVPGGWLYSYFRGKVSTSTFVPFDNEFQPKPIPIKEENE